MWRRRADSNEDNSFLSNRRVFLVFCVFAFALNVKNAELFIFSTIYKETPTFCPHTLNYCLHFCLQKIKDSFEDSCRSVSVLVKKCECIATVFDLLSRINAMLQRWYTFHSIWMQFHTHWLSKFINAAFTWDNWPQDSREYVLVVKKRKTVCVT